MQGTLKQIAAAAENLATYIREHGDRCDVAVVIGQTELIRARVDGLREEELIGRES